MQSLCSLLEALCELDDQRLQVKSVELPLATSLSQEILSHFSVPKPMVKRRIFELNGFTTAAALFMLIMAQTAVMSARLVIRPRITTMGAVLRSRSATRHRFLWIALAV